MRLSDVCEIQLGFTARGRLEHNEHGNVLALQLRDVSPGTAVDFTGLTRIHLHPVPEKYLVRNGDVVFRSRGESTTAAVVDSLLPAMALAVLPLMILRPDPRVLSGAYLAWVINQEPAQRHFEENAQGTSLRMVSRSDLEALPVAVPSIENQKRILEINVLVERDRELAQRLTHLRRQLFRRLLVEQAGKRASMKSAKRTTK